MSTRTSNFTVGSHRHSGGIIPRLYSSLMDGITEQDKNIILFPLNPLPGPITHKQLKMIIVYTCISLKLLSVLSILCKVKLEITSMQHLLQ